MSTTPITPHTKSEGRNKLLNSVDDILVVDIMMTTDGNRNTGITNGGRRFGPYCRKVVRPVITQHYLGFIFDQCCDIVSSDQHEVRLSTNKQRIRSIDDDLGSDRLRGVTVYSSSGVTHGSPPMAVGRFFNNPPTVLP